MSSLTYYNDEGAGQKNNDLYHYSQAVVIGDIVKCSGQGGWDPSGEIDGDDIEGQVALVFQNVDRVLQTVGMRGWEDVYSVRSYHVDMDSSFNLCVENLKKRIPNHKPLWTAIGVTKLAIPKMKIEIEVEAYAKSN
ncbi:endoribonuclease L-PSP [Schizosaccharomyces cryophilus OY26]|uniref:Endoribonuclease L-PSP n=1 Tax=Schizosaccharomyces cryophilus (strain OY26 / ATCC MYA-4695 / CBS 11777 / NBRC 106824 / NRRL Y48691) TaxID=653667 RepID=S9W541_SCHCR|nr:endoribonuclease L-PSP [Schizosaccharomyces cryophilus OY26]EPY53030.1 endoribonuclease L-PSP [Schizosaccharomyces cryophilus OY26]